MRLERRAGIFIGLGGATVVAVVNCVILTASLSAFAARPENQTASTDHLPILREAYALPTEPSFVQSLSVRAIYVDVEENPVRPILKHDIDRPVALASLTKLMTALVVLDQNPDWQTVITFEASDRRGGAKTPLLVGQRVTIDDFWTMALMSSDNDATAALVRATGLSNDDFVVAMNKQAEDLGMQNTHFTEPTGLGNDNLSTARDVARLARAAFAEPKIRETLALANASVRLSDQPTRIWSSDQAIKDPSLSGGQWEFITGKTGFIEEGGYNAAVLVSEKNAEVLVVVLGAETLDGRAKAVDALADWAGREIESQ